MRIEKLEDRHMLASNLRVVQRGDNTYITGEDTNTYVEISQNGSMWDITNRGTINNVIGQKTISVEMTDDLYVRLQNGKNSLFMDNVVVGDDLTITGGNIGVDRVWLNNLDVVDNFYINLRDSNDQIWVDGIITEDAYIMPGDGLDIVELKNLTVEDYLRVDMRDANNQLAVSNVTCERERIMTRGDERNFITLGEGETTFKGGDGTDIILVLADSKEPNPAQTNGTDGRVTSIIPNQNDVIYGGGGGDVFRFRPLIDAKPEIQDKHRRDDGSVNWAAVAGENDNVHDHWVKSIGHDIIMDYNKEEGDRIQIIGHTIEIAAVVQRDDYTLIQMRSQQGNNGGAHDEDLIGEIYVYGDPVERNDIRTIAGVTYGVDQLDNPIRAKRAKANGDGAYVSNQ